LAQFVGETGAEVIAVFDHENAARFLCALDHQLKISAAERRARWFFLNLPYEMSAERVAEYIKRAEL